MRYRKWIMRIGALSLLLPVSACRSNNAEETVATAFLESVRLQDTATIRYLSAPDVADHLVESVRFARIDPRLSLALATAQPQVRRSGQLIEVIFPVSGAGDGSLEHRVTVKLTGAVHPRVEGYSIVPDLSP